MKRYIYLAIHYCFYIASLLFLPKEISLFMVIFLMSVLTFENPFFIILPLIICLYLPLSYLYIIGAVLCYHILFYFFIKKNRYYAFGIFLLSILTCFFILWITEGFQMITLQILLLLVPIYAIINLLYVYQKEQNKIVIIPYNQKLINLTLLLGYGVIIILYSTEKNMLINFLFMQLYIICDIKYNFIFGGIYALYLGITKIFPITNALIPLAISFIPISAGLVLSYNGYLWIPLLIYSIIIQFCHFKDKKISVETDYINALFDDFNKYLNLLNQEYAKNNQIKEIKENKLQEISSIYCNHCHKNTLCKSKMDRRYSFLSGAMLGLKQNIFDCPYYSKFEVDLDLNYANKAFEYSAIKSLAFELSFLYNQSLLLKKEYNHFMNLLANYGYIPLHLDINLASPSLFFSIELSHQKPLIESLLLRCSYKAFGEALELKIVDHKIYFYKKPMIKITYAHTILAKEGNLMSGDNYYIKKDFNSSYIFALSDGMGSGLNAYTESKEALKTIKTLSSYHFRTKTILKLLEDIYELRSNYDRYATLDFLSIDTANRKLQLYKMGSSSTYILHNHQLYTYENQTLPLKLDEVNSSYELDIYSGDFIFLLSDGIGDFITPDEFFSIIENQNQTADEACYAIIEYIKHKENNQLKDDLSLIVIKAI